MSFFKKLNIIFIISSSILFVKCTKKNQDSIVTEQTSDSLTAKGLYNANLKEGVWSYNDKDGKLVGFVEFIIINNNSIYNQALVFNKKGDTIHEKTSFYKFHYINDTLLNISFKGLFDNLYKDGNLTYLLYNNNINENFSNLSNLKFDTLYFENNKIELKNKSKEFKGIIKEFHLDNDSTYTHREIFVKINKNSKNFPNK